MNTYKNKLGYYLSFLIVIFIYYIVEFFQFSKTIWGKDDYAYLPVVLLFLVHLYYSKFKNNREKLLLREFCNTRDFLALVLVLFVCFISLVINDPLLIVLSQIVIVAFYINVLFGYNGFIIFSIPLLLSFLLIPLPGVVIYYLTHALKEFVSSSATDLLYFCGFPIARDGVTIYISNYQLLVADACSGMNSIISLSTFGLLAIYIFPQKKYWFNFILLFTIIPIAVIANLVRVMLLILITYYYGDELAQGFLHQAAGFVLYLCSLSIFWMFHLILRKCDAK